MYVGGSVHAVWPEWANFRPLGDYYFGYFCVNYRNSSFNWATLFQGKICEFIFTKNGLGYMLGDFFTNASDHTESMSHEWKTRTYVKFLTTTIKILTIRVRIPPGHKISCEIIGSNDVMQHTINMQKEKNKALGKKIYYKKWFWWRNKIAEQHQKTARHQVSAQKVEMTRDLWIGFWKRSMFVHVCM
jgi:hypothetical protein